VYACHIYTDEAQDPPIFWVSGCDYRTAMRRAQYRLWLHCRSYDVSMFDYTPRKGRRMWDLMKGRLEMV